MKYRRKEKQIMSSLRISGNVCRVCLEHEVMLNWNEEMFEFCSMTYKECYYKYTELQEYAEDPFPTNLCEVCANEFKRSYLLFKKALESLKILQSAFKLEELETEESDNEICVSQSAYQAKSQSLEFEGSNEMSGNDSPMYENALINMEEENAITNSKESTNSDADEMETRYFIDIQAYESSSESLLEQQLGESFDKKIPKDSVTNKADKNRKQITSSAEALLDQNIGNSCDVETSVASLLTRNGNKKRKKNLLMCAHCSLKVNGASKLKEHEATHSENRKRTETCPQCGIKLYNKLALTNHMKIHDENRQKKYKCEFCEKAFFNRGGLTVHSRIHLGLMVTCMICSKEFYRQIDLDRHLLAHSVSPIQKTVRKYKYTVQCQYCNKPVVTGKWKEHKAEHLDQPQMECTICEKKFFARSKCINHLRRFHRKSKSEYDDFIHYLVETNTRTSILMLKQQEKVQPLTE